MLVLSQRIMLVARHFGRPLVHKLSPTGLLCEPALSRAGCRPQHGRFSDMGILGRLPLGLRAFASCGPPAGHRERGFPHARRGMDGPMGTAGTA